MRRPLQPLQLGRAAADVSVHLSYSQPCSHTSDDAAAALWSFAERRCVVLPSLLSQTGVEVEELSFQSHRFRLKEVGGCLQSTFPSYWQTAAVVILCVSSALPAALSASLCLLLSLLSSASLLPQPPSLLLVLTGIDSPFALGSERLDSVCRLEDVAEEWREGGRELLVRRCSAVTGEGCDSLLQELCKLLVAAEDRQQQQGQQRLPKR